MENEKKETSVKIWGIKFDLLSLENFIEKIDERIKNNSTPIHITGVNPETVVHASKDNFMQNAILDSDFVNIDNTTILMTLRMLGYSIPARVATPDLFEALLELANKENYRVFILGARKIVLNQAIDNIKNDYPSLIVNGHDGYFSRDEEHLLVEKIKKNKPDFLFIALPSPEKELFILKYKNEMNIKLFLGVGGAIDCRGGLIKRAPKFLRNIGLEGIHRALQNPLYFGKKYFTFYPIFFKIVFNSLKNRNKV